MRVAAAAAAAAVGVRRASLAFLFPICAFEFQCVSLGLKEREKTVN